MLPGFAFGQEPGGVGRRWRRAACELHKLVRLAVAVVRWPGAPGAAGDGTATRQRTDPFRRVVMEPRARRVLAVELLPFGEEVHQTVSYPDRS